MIRRKRIIGVRLSFEEVEQFQPLLKLAYCSTWSDVIRRALREMLDANPQLRPITVSNTAGGVKQAMPLFDKKRTRKASAKKGRKTRRKVA